MLYNIYNINLNNIIVFRMGEYGVKQPDLNYSENHSCKFKFCLKRTVFMI